MTALAIEARGLRFAYDGTPVVRDVSLTVREGEMVGLIGPNGAGKSTPLRVLLGFLAPDAGTVQLAGRPVGDMTRREIARLAAFVPQGFHTDFAFSVRDMVAMGRTPHLGRLEPERARDREAVTRALEATEVASMAGSRRPSSTPRARPWCTSAGPEKAPKTGRSCA